MGTKSNQSATNWWLARGLRADYLALYDPLWLALRVGLSNGWLYRSGMEKNLSVLRNYFLEEPSLNRSWQVLTFLNEIVTRYENNPPQDATLLRDIKIARQSIRELYQQFFQNDHQFIIFTAEDLVSRWRLLPQAAQKKVLNNLGRRPALHNDSPHRAEISWFISIVKNVKDSAVMLDER